MTTLVAAVDAVAAAVLELRRRRPRDDDDDADAVVKITLDAAALAELEEVPLTRVYRAFLQRHSSHDFVDAGLVCGARTAWISAATSVLELTALHRDDRGWAPHWLVCAIDGDNCYVLDLDARSADGEDCPVLYVPADSGKVETVAPGFALFLAGVARDSLRPPADREDRPKPPGLVWSQRRDAEAAGAAEAEDRRQLIVPLALAVVAALLLWWLR